MSSNVSTPTVADAIDQFTQGNMANFHVLYANFGREILSFVASRCRGRLDPDDIAQDVWVRVINSHQQFTGGNFRAWLFQISRNYMIDQFRKKGESQLAEEFDQPDYRSDQDDDRSDELHAMKQCLETLGGPFVTVLMAQLSGESTQAIADREDIGVNTVYSRVSRAKDQVKTCVESKLQ